MDASVAEVEALLQSEQISAVPVLDNAGAVLGLITVSDAMSLQLKGRDPASTRAWEICSYRPVEVRPDTPLVDVANLMLAHQIHHVVVMEHGVVKGMVSSLDFVKLFADQATS